MHAVARLDLIFRILDASEKPDPCTVPVAGVDAQTDPTETANR